jgi:capsular polysaccharide biosynthesis protein
MDFTLLARVLLRRWYVIAAVLAVTVAGCFALVQVSPPPYEAKGTVVLLAPSNAVNGGTGSNPYLAFGSALQTTSTVLSAEMLDNSTVVALRSAGFTAQSYTVAPSGFGAAPLVQVTVKDPNADVALKDMHLLLTELPKQLQALQRESGAPLNTYITANPVTTDKQAVKVYKTLEKLVALLAIVGIIIAITLARIVESMSVRRRERRALGAHPPVAEKPVAPAAEGAKAVVREPVLKANGAIGANGANGANSSNGTAVVHGANGTSAANGASGTKPTQPTQPTTATPTPSTHPNGTSVIAPVRSESRS